MRCFVLEGNPPRVERNPNQAEEKVLPISLELLEEIERIHLHLLAMQLVWSRTATAKSKWSIRRAILNKQ